MPFLALDADDPNLPQLAAAAAAQLPPGAPVVAMAHGYRWSPGGGRNCPHNGLYAVSDGWSARLGFGGSDPAEGLAIGLGWNGRGSIWRAAAAAERAGQRLAELAEAVAGVHGPIDVLAHSLGARLALAGVAGARAGSFGRVILLAAAAFGDEARRALARSGAATEYLNVSGRENRLFDLALAALVGSPGGPVLGAGLADAPPNWLDIDIDAASTRRTLRRLGFDLAPRRRLVCHWSVYTRPGLLPFYAALLRRRRALPLSLLRPAGSETALAGFSGGGFTDLAEG